MTERIIGGQNYSPECPECGSPRSTVRSASLDSHNHRIRLRKCLTCHGMFTTLEVSIPFSFSAADALKRERHNTQGPSRGSTDSFDVTPGRSDSIWMIYLRKGERNNLCGRGLHELEGDNVYVHPSGQRICRPCRRATMRASYRNRIDKMPPVLRDELREQRRLESARRVEYRKEWAKRKRAAA